MKTIKVGAVGAKVMYCGHDGWFVADIILVGDVCVVRGPIKGVTGGNLIRGRNNEATHLLMDFPVAGAWMPERGVFVVPQKQVRVLEKADIREVSP